jgi:TRAP-type uncharacterized transport system substrate-binding protein
MNKRLIVTVGLLALTFVALFVAFTTLQPTPPRKIVMSTGPAGSAYAQYAEQYREILAQDGIELELQDSDGTIENFNRLNDPDDEISVAFVTLGIKATENAKDLESLGTVFFEPIWFFFRNPDLSRANLQIALGERLSIGLPGSVTNFAARRLLELNGIDTDIIEMLNLEPHEAAARLKAGTVDSAVFVNAASMPLIKDLLATEGITLGNFERADAYVALFPPLSKLKVPTGLGDLAKNLPPNDVNIVSFSAMLGIRSDLHPAIQTLLLDAAMQVHAVPDIFHADGSFPSPHVFSIPLSSNAANYYQSGKPFLHRYLPFWLAVLVMQILVAALPLIGVIYPAVRSLPALFDWAMRRRIFNIYGQLRAVEGQLSMGTTDVSQTELLEELDQIEQKVLKLRLPVTFSHLVFNLRSHVGVVRARIMASPRA